MPHEMYQAQCSNSESRLHEKGPTSDDLLFIGLDKSGETNGLLANHLLLPFH